MLSRFDAISTSLTGPWAVTKTDLPLPTVASLVVRLSSQLRRHLCIWIARGTRIKISVVLFYFLKDIIG